MTNDTLHTIKNRRSIRKFKAEQIEKKELDALLEAAIYAPQRQQQSVLAVHGHTEYGSSANAQKNGKGANSFVGIAARRL